MGLFIYYLDLRDMAENSLAKLDPTKRKEREIKWRSGCGGWELNLGPRWGGRDIGSHWPYKPPLSPSLSPHKWDTMRWDEIWCVRWDLTQSRGGILIPIPTTTPHPSHNKRSHTHHRWNEKRWYEIWYELSSYQSRHHDKW